MTVLCSGVVWSCPLVSQGTKVFRIPHMDDKLHCINYQLLASSPEIGGTNTFNLGGTWYLLSWHWYQRLPLSPSPKTTRVGSCLTLEFRSVVDILLDIYSMEQTHDKGLQGAQGKSEMVSGVAQW